MDQQIRDLEIINQKVQRKKEKMARLADLQKKIDKATEEVRHLTQDDHDRRPQHRELRQEGSFNEDEWYDDFNHGIFAFDDASPFINVNCDHEGMSFMTFVRRSLYPKGNNASKDEGH